MYRMSSKMEMYVAYQEAKRKRERENAKKRKETAEMVEKNKDDSRPSEYSAMSVSSLYNPPDED